MIATRNGISCNATAQAARGIERRHNDPRLHEACARIAAAARAEAIWAQETNGRLPDASELASAIEDAVRRELFEAQLRAEIRTSRQYTLVLEQILPAS